MTRERAGNNGMRAIGIIVFTSVLDCRTETPLEGVCRFPDRAPRRVGLLLLLLLRLRAPAFRRLEVLLPPLLPLDDMVGKNLRGHPFYKNSPNFPQTIKYGAKKMDQ